jgi:hypothetical protein
MGAWSLPLLQTVGVTLDVALLKSNVVVYEGEFVDHIVGWLDEPGVTVVPFKGNTFIADNRSTPVEHADDLTPVHLESLYEDLATCFPTLDVEGLKSRAVRSYGCIKTGGAEPPPPHPIARIRVFSEKEHTIRGRKETGHGIRGLTVAIPGKASLMFPLAEEVVRLVL